MDRPRNRRPNGWGIRFLLLLSSLYLVLPPPALALRQVGLEENPKTKTELLNRLGARALRLRLKETAPGASALLLAAILTGTTAAPLPAEPVPDNPNPPVVLQQAPARETLAPASPPSKPPRKTLTVHVKEKGRLLLALPSNRSWSGWVARRINYIHRYDGNKDFVIASMDRMLDIPDDGIPYWWQPDPLLYDLGNRVIATDIEIYRKTDLQPSWGVFPQPPECLAHIAITGTGNIVNIKKWDKEALGEKPEDPLPSKSHSSSGGHLKAGTGKKGGLMLTLPSDPHLNGYGAYWVDLILTPDDENRDGDPSTPRGEDPRERSRDPESSGADHLLYLMKAKPDPADVRQPIRDGAVEWEPRSDVLKPGEHPFMSPILLVPDYHREKFEDLLRAGDITGAFRYVDGIFSCFTDEDETPHVYPSFWDERKLGPRPMPGAETLPPAAPEVAPPDSQKGGLEETGVPTLRERVTAIDTQV